MDEKLKIIQLYLFIAIPQPEEQFIFDKELVLQNRWMYNQLIKVIAANRIAVIGRHISQTFLDYPPYQKSTKFCK